MAAIHTAIYSSPIGDMILGDLDGSLCLCDWLDSKVQAMNMRRLRKLTDRDIQLKLTPRLVQTMRELDEYFAEKRIEFDVPVAMVGTEMQVAVWQSLKKIPYGATATYSDIASAVGRPSATRAVASAIGRNPLSVIVPCHRVVAKNGMGGYAGSLARKLHLLNIEGVICPCDAGSD